MLNTGSVFFGLYVFMPSVVIEPSKEGYVWVNNDAEDEMYLPEGTIMGIYQDWVEEEQEMEEYSEPVDVVRGVGEGIQKHMKDMFHRARVGVGKMGSDIKLLLINSRGVFTEHDMDV